MSYTESKIATLSGAIIKFLSDVKMYQKVLINHQEQLKKVERSHMGLLKKLMNMEHFFYIDDGEPEIGMHLF